MAKGLQADLADRQFPGAQEPIAFHEQRHAAHKHHLVQPRSRARHARQRDAYHEPALSQNGYG